MSSIAVAPRWLVSRRFDLTWFFGGALLSLLFLALYFGVETLARLDRDRGKAQALFASGARLAPLIDAIISADIRLGDDS